MQDYGKKKKLCRHGKFNTCHISFLFDRQLGQQCCYDKGGRYITTNKAAGSADYYFPPDYYLEHQSSDFFPYKACCGDENDKDFCDKYYSLRPKDKDNGTNCICAKPNRGENI